MRRFLFLLCIFVSALFIACSESFTDPRDGQSYDIVKIGERTWFAENLNFATEGSVCPEGDSRKCSEYGRLYTWDDARTSCPEGWRLPDSADFANLIEASGGTEQAGESLKSTGGWFKKGNGTDALGFNALPAGYRGAVTKNDDGEMEGGKYDGIGGYAYFWSVTTTPDDLAYYLFLDFSSKATSMNAFPKGDFRSVRCVKAAQAAR
ncbi:MAG: fibrobacter succinogenes major paralogous domain-containing protein [Fibrobacter sp.]|nr:fibrobacter succinogenes major paralogous domain-containing protein [Fibrobacter sp.]